MARARLLVAAAITAALLGIDAPAADALTRKQATTRAVKILKANRQPGVVALFAYRRPLRAGSTVGAAVMRGRGSVRRLRRRTWVFWLDLAYHSMFSHSGRLLALDARSGKVLLRRNTTWAPIVNNRKVPWLGTPRDYTGRRYKVFERPRRARRSVARVAAYPRVAPRTRQLASDCLVTITDPAPLFRPNLRAINGWADAVGMKRRDARPNIAGLFAAVDGAATEGCKDVFIYLAGHGVPPRPSDFPPAAPQVVHDQYRAIPAAEYEGTGDAGVNVNPLVGVRKDRTAADVSDYITPQNLIDLFQLNGDLTFKLKIDSCFSGRFEEVIHRSPNLLIAEFSSRFNEVSIANAPPGTRVPQLEPGTRVPVRKGGNLVYLTDRTDNPDGASEFTNANVHGLYEWAQIAPEDQRLVQAIDFSFIRGASEDFGRKVGLTNPFILRR